MSFRISVIKSWLAVLLPLFAARPAPPAPDFVVYFVQGGAVKLNDHRHPRLKKGDDLYTADMIALSAHTEVVLVCKSHNCIKLDKPDTVRMSSLAARCAAEKTSFVASYFRFIWDELTGQSTPDPQNYIHNMGAVSRGAGQQVFIDSINYCSGNLQISLGLNADQLTLAAFDDAKGGRLLTTMHAAADNFHVDSLAARLAKPGLYYWTISGQEPEQKNRYRLKIWNMEAYKRAVGAILKQVVKTSPAETAYMSGFVLEKNAFLYEAKKQYELANRLEPGNKLYHTTYSRFL